MALRATIQAQVDNLFGTNSPLQDFVVEVALRQNSSETPVGYNFATGSITNNTPTEATTVRGIFLSEEKTSGDGNRKSFELLLRVADVADIDVYDTFEVTSGPWAGMYRLISYTSDSFVLTLTVSGANDG